MAELVKPFCGRCGQPAILRSHLSTSDPEPKGQGYWYECINEAPLVSCGISGPIVASEFAAALSWGEMTAWIMKGKPK